MIDIIGGNNKNKKERQDDFNEQRKSILVKIGPILIEYHSKAWDAPKQIPSKGHK